MRNKVTIARCKAINIVWYNHIYWTKCESLLKWCWPQTYFPAIHKFPWKPRAEPTNWHQDSTAIKFVNYSIHTSVFRKSSWLLDILDILNVSILYECVFKEQVAYRSVSVKGVCVYMTKTYHTGYLWEIESRPLNDVSQSEDGTQWISLGMIQTPIDITLIHTLHQVTPREKKVRRTFIC